MKIVLTQGQYAEVDDSDFDRLNQWSWYASKRKPSKAGTIHYDAVRSWQGCTILMTHVLILPKPYYAIHHKNGNTLDNHRANLIALPYEEHVSLHTRGRKHNVL